MCCHGDGVNRNNRHEINHDTTKVFKSLQTRYLHTTPVEQRSLLVPINSAFVTSDQHSTIYVSSVLVAMELGAAIAGECSAITLICNDSLLRDEVY